MTRLLRLAGVALLTLLTVGGASPPANAAVAEALAAEVDYVALGDSYTAGPLIPTTTGGGCVRSTIN